MKSWRGLYKCLSTQYALSSEKTERRAEMLVAQELLVPFTLDWLLKLSL